MYHYLALLWNPAVEESALTSRLFVANLTAKNNGWATAHAGPGMLVVHTSVRDGSANAYPLAHCAGIVVGNLFKRDDDDYSSRPPLAFDAAETMRILESRGKHLVDRYWGSYVAFFQGDAAAVHHVIREPMAGIACYRLCYQGINVIFSHLEDAIRFLPMTLQVNRRYLARWLVFSQLSTNECGLDGVEDLPAGERLTFSDVQTKRERLWDPATFASDPRFEDPDEAMLQLRSTVQRTVDAWASCYQRIVHRLSGGLDSSIVAGCLARSPSKPEVTYLNFSISLDSAQETIHLPGMDKRLAARLRAIAGHGDERYFARLIAERWSVPIIERERNVSMSLTRLWDTPFMTSPPLFFSSVELDDAKVELATQHGIQAFFSGHPGDAVFLATFQPLPAIDYAHMHGLTPGLWQHVLATASLSGESVWTVLAKAIRHGVLRRPYRHPLRVLDQPTLLNQEVFDGLTEDDFFGPLTHDTGLLPPGKRNHATGIGRSACHDYVFRSGSYADDVDPLNSQPVWETVLRIPTYTMLAAGVSRGLARKAFAELLPDEIRRRTVKGTGTPFYQQLVRKNLAYIRDQLLDGWLVREKYLHREKLKLCLGAEEPFLMVSAPQILSYLSAEVWARQCLDSRCRAAA